MDADIVFIFSFAFLIIAFVFGMFHLFHRRNIAAEERKLELEARIEEAKAAQAAAPNEVQAHLEDRLRVVERIVTDPSSNLAKEIEDLGSLKTEGENAV